MEPTSNPDSNRSPRGLARFWPVHREDEESSAEPESVVLPGETQMVALGSRRGAEAELTPPAAGANPFGPAQTGASPFGPVQAGANPFGPAQTGANPFGPAQTGANPFGPVRTGAGPFGPLQAGGATSAFPLVTRGGAPGGGAAFASAARGPGGGAPADGPEPGAPIGKTPGGATPMPAGPVSPPAGGGPASAATPGGGAGTVPGGQHTTPEGDPDRSGASETGEGPAQAVESSRANPWDRDTGAFGGFGLGGRNGRFLFGGRDTPGDPQPGVNGHGGPELNGRPGKPAGEASTVDDPAAEEAADQAQASDENGRDDMNGRAGVPAFTAPGDVPAEKPAAADLAEARGRDLGDTEGDVRRQATGWASVPTSTHPVVTPTSGAPISPAPVSPGFTPSGYGQPPTYVPALPDPGAGPVSGVPAPRAAAGPATAPAVKPGIDTLANGKPPAVAGAGPVSPAGPAAPVTSPVAKAPIGTLDTSPQPLEPADNAAAVRTDDERRPWEDEGAARTPAPRRSASLEDAEPARRGRRAAPEDDDEDQADLDHQAAFGAEPAPAGEQALRPGDIEAGHIAFWDDDATRHFRAAWHEVKAEFVDDPVRALTRAHDLLTDAVNELTEALLAERDELDPLRGSGTPDTESMRMAMRGYREFLDRILAL